MSVCVRVGRLERVLFALAGSITLASVALAIAVSPWFLAAAVFAAANQWLYALAGNCPASLILRRLGVAGGRDA
jgi:hypothetical protein